MLQGRFERSRSGRVRGQKCCEAAGWGAPAEPPIPAESRDGGGQSEAEPRLLALAQCRGEMGFFLSARGKTSTDENKFKKGRKFPRSPAEQPRSLGHPGSPGSVSAAPFGNCDLRFPGQL